MAHIANRGYLVCLPYMKNNQINASGTNFGDLGIAPKLLEILDRHNFKIPTPIQFKSIPLGIEGKDIMGIAQTGTGKTLAFGLPMIQRLAQNREKGLGLVVLPTRELALQVNETFKKIGTSIGLKTAVLIGGESMHRQLRMLQDKPHIIIGTPGRLIDHLENGRLKLEKVEILVLDEADRMLDMGFAPQIKRILQNVPKQRQTMLFSATMPDQIVQIAKSYMSLPLRIEVAPAGTAVELVSQEVFFIPRDQKVALLKNILKERTGSVLVFMRTKHGAKKIAQTIRAAGETSAEIHSNRSLNQRLEALEGFKIGRYRVLVATDIAARGIDVKGIQLVLNYDLPDNPEDYVHRIGRSGRAGMTGHAISFAMPEQRREVQSIERLIRKALAISKTPELPKSFDDQRFDDREPRPRHERQFSRSRGNSNAGRGSFGNSRENSSGTSDENSGGSSGHKIFSPRRNPSRQSGKSFGAKPFGGGRPFRGNSRSGGSRGGSSHGSSSSSSRPQDRGFGSR